MFQFFVPFSVIFCACFPPPDQGVSVGGGIGGVGWSWVEGHWLTLCE